MIKTPRNPCRKLLAIVDKNDASIGILKRMDEVREVEIHELDVLLHAARHLFAVATCVYWLAIDILVHSYPSLSRYIDRPSSLVFPHPPSSLLLFFLRAPPL